MQQGRRNRVRVILDGEVVFSLPRILAAELSVGQSLSEQEVARLQERDAQEEAYQRGLRLLSRRPRSEQELREYYSRQRTPDMIQETALSRLREAGLMDDAGFARFWVENRQAFRPKSAAALRAELRRKGVAPENVQTALAGLDEQGAAERAARQGARRLRGAEREEFRRRLGSYLARRGFDYTIIRSVVEQMWTEMSGPDAESEDVPWKHRL
jgi:regulatory protein